MTLVQPTEERVLGAQAAGSRLDRAAAEAFPLGSRSLARRLIEQGALLLNGGVCEPSRYVRPGDRLTLLHPAAPDQDFDHPLELVLVDPHFAVVLKPPGLETSGGARRTVENALPGHLPASPAPGALPRARAVHRLDLRTGGLLLFARTAEAAAALGRAFEERRVRKRYRALAAGRLEGEGRIEDRLDGKPAASTWVVRGHARSLHTGWITTVDVHPESGRKHQVRRHLAGLGCPVLGDDRYGEGPVLRSQGLFLFAAELEFPHPSTGLPVVVRASEPPKFESFRRREQRRWEGRAPSEG